MRLVKAFCLLTVPLGAAESVVRADVPIQPAKAGTTGGFDITALDKAIDPCADFSNMPEFQKAFGCKTGQAMVKQEMCRVW